MRVVGVERDRIERPPHTVQVVIVVLVRGAHDLAVLVVAPDIAAHEVARLHQRARGGNPVAVHLRVGVGREQDGMLQREQPCAALHGGSPHPARMGHVVRRQVHDVDVDGEVGACGLQDRLAAIAVPVERHDQRAAHRLQAAERHGHGGEHGGQALGLQLGRYTDDAGRGVHGMAIAPPAPHLAGAGGDAGVGLADGRAVAGRVCGVAHARSCDRRHGPGHTC